MSPYGDAREAELATAYASLIKLNLMDRCQREIQMALVYLRGQLADELGREEEEIQNAFEFTFRGAQS